MQELQEYRQAWAARYAAEKKALKQRKDALRQKARDCALTLMQNYFVSQIYLFGSLAGDGLIHKQSDIDLAVEGLRAEDYFHALAMLYAIPPTDVNVDLITLEDAPPRLRLRIESTGEQLL